MRKGFEAFERDSKHSKVIRSIRMQIRTIRKEFKACEWKFEEFESDSKYCNENSNHLKGFDAFECKFEPFEKVSKHLNANLSHSKGIRSI